ncbi:MAG: hypothetical protein PHQ40_04125 [Anaerolineaceae bacterium]|nr:hypothetical protein [Anaerolineaceae bacterium]
MPVKKPMHTDDQLRNLEIELEDQFLPVRPDPEFVHRLRRRLVSSSGVTLEGQDHLLNLVLALGIVMAGLFAVVALIRGIYGLVKVLDLIHKTP